MIAVLYARRDSVYKQIPICDVYDEDRDARTFSFGIPVVAHPPCRGWGRLRKFAKPAPHEKDLAHHAISCVRACGGVLEHPSSSSLWQAAELPRPGQGRDEFGGWSIEIPQFWFGHRAMKNTWLYICGVTPRQLPPIPLRFGTPTHVVAPSKSCRAGASLPRAEREATPIAFAHFLVDLANSAHNFAPRRSA